MSTEQFDDLEFCNFACQIVLEMVWLEIFQVPGYEDGNFVGPTLVADVRTDMECYEVYCVYMIQMNADTEIFNNEMTITFSIILQEEIFGPVLLCMEVHISVL